MQGGFVGLRSFDLRLGACSLGANVGVVELQQELALAHVIAFFDQQAFYRGRDRSVGFEVLNGLNLPVGGDHAADGTALDRDGTYFERSRMKIRISMARIASSVNASQIHRLRDGGCELLVDANQLSFRVRQE